MFTTLLLVVAANAMNQGPNVLLILVDDLPYTTDWSAMSPPGTDGNTFDWIDVPTPAIQTFMDDGSIVIPRSYAGGPVCSPSRYSLLTGRYPTQSLYGQKGRSYNGFNGSLVTVANARLMGDDKVYNLQSTLQKHGYYTGQVGKWHLMADDPYDCATLDKTPDAAKYANCKELVKETGFDAVEAWYYGNIVTNSLFSHNPEYMLSEAQKMINTAINVEEKPFFIYFSFTLNHSPSPLDSLQYWTSSQSPKGELIGDEIPSNTGMKTRQQIYDETMALNMNSFDSAMAAGALWVDDAIGAMVNYLKGINQYDNTFIALLNDHGVKKSALYEQGSRILQILRYPPLFDKNNDRSSAFMMPQDFITSNVDLSAVIFEVAGIAPNSSYILDGSSYLNDIDNIIYGQSTENTCCQERYGDIYNSHMIINEQYQYIWRADPSTISSKIWNYPFASSAEQLYDLTADPNQQINLIDDPNGDLYNLICDFKIKMGRYVYDKACHEDVCNVPDVGTCPTVAPTSAPTATPTVPTSAPTLSDTTCIEVRGAWSNRFSGVSKVDVADATFLQQTLDESAEKFSKKNRDCISDPWSMQYVYKTTYKRRAGALNVYFIVCCGDNHLFTVEQLSDNSLIPTDYKLPGVGFNIFYDDEDETEFGAKQILSVCLICLIVIGVIGSAIYCVRQKRKERANEAQKTNDKNTKLAPISENKKIDVPEQNDTETTIEPAAIATPSAGPTKVASNTKFIDGADDTNAYGVVNMEVLNTNQ